jgi:hypothetical protein
MTAPRSGRSSLSEISEGHFTTEAQALAEIEAMGWHALVRDVVVPSDEDLLWHDFRTVVFVVSGMLRVADEQGRVTEIGPGSRARASARTLHREVGGSSYRAVFGFDVAPTAFSRPLNKPESMLHAPQ